MPKGPTDADTDVINTPYFYGGSTIDPKLGIPNSFYQSAAMDFRSVPSQISVLPGMRTLSSVLYGLITVMEQDLNGVRYGVDTIGWLYRIDISNNVTPLFKMSTGGSSGMTYNSLTDQLYIPGQQTISMYGRLTSAVSAAQWRSDQFAQSASNAPGCTNLFDAIDGFYDGAFRSTAALTTPIAAGILNESTYCSFVPDIEPFYSIQVYLATLGTGDYTLTLHDSLNNVLAVTTVAHAALGITSPGFVEFKFTAPGVRAIVNASQTGSSASYHWHITSTVADGAVATVNANDMTSANFLLYAFRLVQPANGLHPTGLFFSGGTPVLCIGNGNYLATYDFTNDAAPTNQQFQRHLLQFKMGEEVCGSTSTNQYYVIAVERRSKVPGRNFQAGALYFWDGTVTAPNFKIDIPMGAPYGVHNSNNVVYFCCAGALYAWQGGQTVIKVRKLAYEQTDYLNAVDKTFVYPNMLTDRYNLLCIGYPSISLNPNTSFGVWTWGSVELTYPNSFGLSYQLANGQTNYSSANNLQMGCCVNFVDSMYTSWSYIDSNSIQRYGIDLVDNFSAPALSGFWTSLIWDGQVTYKQKRSYKLKTLFLPLPAGYTVQSWYALDRGTKVFSAASNTVGDRSILQEVPGRFNEIQWGFIWTNTGSATAPIVFIDCSIELDSLASEVKLRKDEYNVNQTGTN